MVCYSHKCCELGLLILIHLLSATSILGQQSEPISYAEILDKRFDFGEGEVVDIQEDWLGFIWIATTEGLYKFDGTQTRRYDNKGTNAILPHPNIYCIYIDNDEKLIWIGTRGGLSRFDPINETAQHYKTNYKDSTSLADNIIRYIFEDSNGTLWISCLTRGLSEYQPETDNFKHHNFTHPNLAKAKKRNPRITETLFNNFYVINEHPLNPNKLYLGCGGGILLFDAQQGHFDILSTNIPKTDALKNHLERSVGKIINAGNSIIFSEGLNILKYNILDNSLHPILINQSYSSTLGSINRLFLQGDSMLLVGYDKGSRKINHQTGKVMNERIDKPTQYEFYGTRFIDRQGRQWINSSNRLTLKQLTPNSPLGYSYGGDAKTEAYYKIDSATILFLTSDHNHLLIFDRNKEEWIKKSFIAPTEVLNNEGRWLKIVQDSAGTYYFLSARYLFRCDIKTGQINKVDLAFYNDQVTFQSMLKDQFGNLWLSTLFDGVYKVSQTGKITHHKDVFKSEIHESLYSWMWDLLEDSRGHIWIRMSRSYAVYFPNLDTFKVFAPDQYEDQTFQYVTQFAEDNRGNIWIGSYDDGVGRISLDSLENGIIQTFNVSNGLFDNSNQKLAFNGKSYLLSLHLKGLDLIHLSDYQIRSFTFEQNIPAASWIEFLDTQTIALIMDDVGVITIKTDLFLEKKDPPLPYVTNINVDNKTVYKGTQLAPTDLIIDGNRDNLRIGFSALGNPSQKRFSYRLNGIDNDWIYTENLQSALYTNLKAGDYTFEYRSSYQDNTWSDRRTFHLMLTPRWWETIWFKILIGLAIGSLAWWLYKRRLNDIRIKSQYREQIKNLEMQSLRAQMNPHFLYNSLNSIQHFIIQNKTKEAVGYLDRFSRLVRLILQNSRLKTVTVHDEVQALEHYLELESLRFKHQFRFSITVDEAINPHNIEIPPMLIQPFVENAILHGLATKEDPGYIEIQLQLNDDIIECRITDNGIGREAASRLKNKAISNRKSMGMHITQSRLDILNDQSETNARIKITDLVDSNGEAAGTEVHLFIPI